MTSSVQLVDSRQSAGFMRPSGIDVIGDLPWGAHLCHFYKDKQDLIDILVPYFKEGLKNNEFCMWVTSEPLQTKEATEALRKEVPDLDEYIAKDQIYILPYCDWYTKTGSFRQDVVMQGWLDKYNEALANGWDGIRVTGNTFWIEKDGWFAFKEYESTITETIDGYKILVLCSYSVKKCQAEQLADVVATHEFALIKRESEWAVIENSEYKKTKEALNNERRQLIKERDKAREAQKEIWRSQNFLEIANRETDFTPLLNEFIEEIKGLTGCEAIGIRLADEFGNIPYASCSGFSKDFYNKENFLSIKTDKCMCINVIAGTANPTYSFYTEYGSFFVKGTTKFMATVSGEERGPTRNVCNQHGYESIALIPIRTNGGIIGLIHIADCKENMVSLKLVTLIERISKVLGVSIQRARAHNELAKAYETEHKIAETLQRSLLTEEIPEIDGLEIKYFYQSATCGAAVGGDFYDVFNIPGKGFGLTIGDVSGKGILAAAETAKVKHLLRDRVYMGGAPNDAIAGVNEALARQLNTTSVFTTLTFGIYSPKTATIVLSNAGNPYPYLTAGDRFLKITGVPVGVRSNEKYESVEVRLQKDDIVLLFTDGLTESRRNGEFFGEENVRAFVKKNKSLPLESLITGLVEETRNFSKDNLADDILVLGIKKA